MPAAVNLIWGEVLIIFTLILAWLGQVIDAVTPATAAQWGLSERESDMDPTFYADSRAETIWDAAMIWPLP
jgi:hypothetical protein